ncbi:MAG TPA: FAD-dependent oxidoreductase [Solirubrobacteraceae bacterium]|jgi:sulfide:quinone oxidoreductase|nr:FAD-dependent oxidoreductase [Solirubrobacteraceae bacterium]
MSTPESPPQKLRVLIAGGGVAALETVLALRDLAGERVELRVIAPNEEFVYRPMTVREPFAFAAASRYPLAPILERVGVELLRDELAWVDRDEHVVHCSSGQELSYDALVLALGARVSPRYSHALTIDDRKMDATLHGLIEDVELGYVKSIAFVAPGRMAWPLPLYELALMTAGRAYDMNVELQTTIVTPEERPLAIFGTRASEGVAALLEQAKIKTITSAYAEIPSLGEITISPGERHVHAERIVALPELYGPSLRGMPLSDHGFIRVDRFGRADAVDDVYAAGDATDFAIKQGGIGAQQADVVAESIAALAGADVEPQPFHPIVRGILLTYDKPRYLEAQITGGHGFSSEFGTAPTWEPVSKISARYLAPFLEALDRDRAVA